MNTLGSLMLFGGLFIVIFLMVRLMMKNRDIRNNLKKTALSAEEKHAMLKTKTLANDFGQKLKWTVDIDDGKNDKSSGGS
jgi:hypothetical protein